MVNNEQPHVLVDLNGFTDGGRHEIGALKPAPVSVNYLGFPYTLTIPGFDYILADRLVLPPEQVLYVFPHTSAAYASSHHYIVGFLALAMSLLTALCLRGIFPLV